MAQGVQMLGADTRQMNQFHSGILFYALVGIIIADISKNLMASFCQTRCQFFHMALNAALLYRGYSLLSDKRYFHPVRVLQLLH